jgi:hypothetical protein
VRIAYGEISAQERAKREQAGRRVPNLVRAIANLPDVVDRQLAALDAIRAGLPDRVREVAIMAVAAQTKNGYVWGHHVPWLESLGYTKQQIVGIHDGDPGSLDEADRVLVQLATAVETLSVDDDLWAAAGKYFSERELIQITLLASWYAANLRQQASFDVPQDTGFGGWDD